MRFRPSSLDLARRLEATEAANGFRMAEHTPGAEAELMMGGCALFAGAGSPMTHALGIGMTGPVTAADFDSMEEFFRAHGSAALIDLCPLCDLTVLEQVTLRGYRTIEFNNVMVREVERVPAPAGVRLIGVEDRARWLRVVAQGFSNSEDPPPEMGAALEATPNLSTCFLAEENGEAVAAAAMTVIDGVAFFYGDATRLGYRGKGWQQALIHARLLYAREQGAMLAYGCVLPGSGSHRNYERAGFELAYMRVNYARDL